MNRMLLTLALGVLPLNAQAQIVQPPARLTLGYHADARPFSFENEAGRPAGYAVELCQKVVVRAKAELGFGSEELGWIAVTAQNRLAMLREGKIKLICGEPVTSAAQKQLTFSIPIFQGGVGALVRADAPADPLAQGGTVAVVAGTPTEKVVADQLAKLKAVPVRDYAQGVQAVLERKADVFFADRSVLLDAVRRSPSFGELKVLDRRFTTVPVAIALAPGKEDARLAVDRALREMYGTKEFRSLYTKYFGQPDAATAAFFKAAGAAPAQ